METVAEAFVRNVVLIFILPQIVLTDKGENFLSDFLKRVCKILQIKKIKTTEH